MFCRLAALTALVLAPAPSIAKWSEAKTNHFIIYSQQKPEALRAYATGLERFDSAVRVVRQMKDPPPTSTGRLTLYTLREWQDVSEITGIGGIAGVYMGRVSGPVSFANSQPKRDKWDLDGRTVFFHEYLHHLMLQDATAAYPTWMVEGYAEWGLAPLDAAKQAFGDLRELEALHRSSNLVPQDSSLRMASAFQYLRDKDLKMARRTLVPIAYEPHSQQAATIARKMIERIDAGDSEGALKAAESPGKAPAGTPSS